MTFDLKTRFIVSIILVFVVTAAAAYGALAWIAEEIVGTLGTGFAEKQVQLTRVQSLSPLLREVALARKMADSPALRAWAVDEGNGDLRRQAMAEMESFRRAFRDGSYFFVVHPSGNYYFNDAKATYAGAELRYAVDPGKPADSWYFATVAAGLDYQINVNHDVNLQVTKVWVNVLMKDGDRVLGVLGTGIDLSSFIGEIVASGQQGIENVFVNEDGAVQAFRDVGKIDFASLTKSEHDRASIDRLIDDPEGRAELAQAIHRVAERGEGVETLFLTVGGRRQIVGLTSLKEIRWLAVTMVDLDLLMRQGRFLSVAVILGLALLAALGATGVLLDRLVLRRIRRLEDSARAVAAGSHAVRLEFGPDDEIGRLTQSFARMSSTVKAQKETLEHKVQVAIRDYEDANRRLAARTDDLTRVNAELEEFTTVVSHDLRQPLRMVSSYLALIERTLGRNIHDDLAAYLNYAVDGAKRMDRMLVELLRYCRTGRTEVAMTPVALDDVVEESRHTLSMLFTEAEADLVAEAGLPVILGNRDELSRLFENLFSNALKYRHQQRRPRIVVDSQAGDGVWIVRVGDNGIGISAQNYDRVFKVFQRLENTIDRDGTGVGLAVCKKIVESHGGSISVESTEGEGSMFILRFPVYHPEPPK